jgi:hypothetical protein
MATMSRGRAKKKTPPYKPASPSANINRKKLKSPTACPTTKRSPMLHWSSPSLFKTAHPVLTNPKLQTETRIQQPR